MEFIKEKALLAQALAISFVPNALAQDTVTLRPQDDSEFTELVDTNLTVPAVISWLITVLLVAAAVIFFIMLLIGGIRWILSGGDKGQTENARKQITSALIGLVIVFSAYIITRLVFSIFGLGEDFTFTIPEIGG